MGARVNFVFKDNTGHAVVLYSHWGADTWRYDIANAINHAAPRIELEDTSYATRMMISYLMSESILNEHGYGLFAINPSNPELYDETVIIDMTNKTVDNVPFSEFVDQSFLAEQVIG
jgi:hypothetical protein